MIERFTRWDSADYLKTEADRAEYLEVCMEAARDDSKFIAKAFETITRARGKSDAGDALEKDFRDSQYPE